MPWKVWRSENDRKWYAHITGDNHKVLFTSEGYGRQRDAANAIYEAEYQMLEALMTGKRNERFAKLARRKSVPNSGGTGTSSGRRKTS